MLDATWELSHIAFAVGDLDEAMQLFGRTMGAKFTKFMSIDQDFVAPLSPGGTVRAAGRGIWALGSSPPLELWQGAEGSPWYVPRGTHRLHHLSYWADDLVKRVEQLEGEGFALEHTMPSSKGARVAGFAYMLHPNGTRIELQSIRDKEPTARWVAGGPLVVHWDT